MLPAAASLPRSGGTAGMAATPAVLPASASLPRSRSTGGLVVTPAVMPAAASLPRSGGTGGFAGTPAAASLPRSGGTGAGASIPAAASLPRSGSTGGVAATPAVLPAAGTAPSSLLASEAQAQQTLMANDPGAALGAILRETRRTMKNRQLYSHIEDHGEDQLRALHARMVQFLEINGEVSLRIEVSALRWGEVEVFDDDARDINFGYSLYRAGVRVLVFRPGLAWEEFLSFWTLVAEDLIEQDDEDLLTKLWTRGYESIAWVAQNLIEDSDASEALPEYLRQTQGGALQDFTSDALIAGHGLALAKMLEGFGQQAAAQGPPGSAHDGRPLDLSEQNAERIRVVGAVALTLLDIAQLQSIPASGQFITDSFEQLVGPMMADHGAAQVGVLVGRAFGGLAKNAGTVQETATREALSGILRAVRTPENILRLRAQCEDTHAALPVASMIAITRLLVPEGSEMLLTLLEGKLPNELRAVVLQALTQVAPTEAVHISRRLRTADERQACGLLDVLVVLAVPRPVMQCEPALTHPSPVVRRHALMVMARCKDNAGSSVLFARQLERVTEIEERLFYIAALGSSPCPESERVLSAYVQREGIEAREQEAAWSALLSSSSVTALSLAERVAAQGTRGFLGSSKEEAAKTTLVEALGRNVERRCLAILLAIAQDKTLSSRKLHKRAQELLAARSGTRE